MTRSENNFEIKLRNAEGVPVLQICGDITESALRSMKSMLEKLASAGHYNIVINLERAQAANWKFLTNLTDTVRNIRSHYGAVDIVATQELIQQLIKIDPISHLFRLSRSESQAISRIKRLFWQTERISQTNARLLENP